MSKNGGVSGGRRLPVEGDAAVEEVTGKVGAVASGLGHREAGDRARLLELEREGLGLDELVLREQGDVRHQEESRAAQRLEARTHVGVADLLVRVECRGPRLEGGDERPRADADVRLQAAARILGLRQQMVSIQEVQGDRGDVDVGGLQPRPDVAGHSAERPREANRLRTEVWLEVIDVELGTDVAAEHVLPEKVPGLATEDDRRVEGEIAGAPVDEGYPVELERSE